MGFSIFFMKSFFFNYKIDKRELQRLLGWFVQSYGCAKTTRFADTLKYVGFHYAMRGGVSIGIDDLHIAEHKYQLVNNAYQELRTTTILAQRGEVTAAEKFRKVIDMWAWTSEQVKKEIVSHFQCHTPVNPVYMMAFSGARGNVSQVRQLVGMRGLMADPKGDLIDMPIRSNFREGLTIVEYIISCYGSRKGVVDTALRTANSGYLTRRLVEVAQETSIYAITCLSRQSVPMTPLHDHESDQVVLPLATRLIGRVLAHTVYMNKRGTSEEVLFFPFIESNLPPPKATSPSFPSGKAPFLPLSSRKATLRQKERSKEGGRRRRTAATGRAAAGLPSQALALRNTDITPQLAHHLARFLTAVPVRSPFTCESESKDICQFCYGWGLQGADLVPLGEAVGVVAAQSIGEPGTQLTMRTFHTGGVFSGRVREKLVSPHAGRVHISHTTGAPIRTPTGDLAFLLETPACLAIVGHTLTVFSLPAQSLLHVVPGQRVAALSVIGELLPPLVTNASSVADEAEATALAIVSERSGQIFFDDLYTLTYSTVRKSSFYAYRFGCLWVIGGEILYTPYFFHPGDLVCRYSPPATPALRTIDRINEIEARGIQTFFLARQNYMYTHLLTPPCVHVGDFIQIGQMITATHATAVGGLVFQIRHTSYGWLVCLREVTAYAVERRAGLYVQNNALVHPGQSLFRFYYTQQKTGDIVQGLPKIEQLFEVRTTKGEQTLPRHPKKILLLYFFYFRTCGLHVNHATLLSMVATQCFLLNAIQRVYQTQGVGIVDKHLEVIIREMCTFVCIVEPGITAFLHGEIVNHQYLRKYNTVESYPTRYVPLVFGLTKLGLLNESFLSAASFQQTRKVLMLSALHGAHDQLTTIKHAILVGKLMPLGPANFYVLRAFAHHIAHHHALLDSWPTDDQRDTGEEADQLLREGMRQALIEHEERKQRVFDL
jgi:hypothetical protein